MDFASLERLSDLSPFELKDTLLRPASSPGERTMLNAGVGNPNFLATIPRHGFLQLGQVALNESERAHDHMNQGIGGLPERAGIESRFEDFLATYPATAGPAFLKDAVAYVHDELGIPADGFLYEMVEAVLGCEYPDPVRMLTYSEQIVRRYVLKEMTNDRSIPGTVESFATEGGTAAIGYIFNSLRENCLLAPGDTIALGMPIYAPYLEIPQLGDYRLTEVWINASEQAGWQYPRTELDKLIDPKVKALVVVNPGNPTSVKIDGPNGAGKTTVIKMLITLLPPNLRQRDCCRLRHRQTSREGSPHDRLCPPDALC